MNLHYISDRKGKKSAVQLPMNDWELIQKNLEELDRLRNKKLFLTELAEAVEEIKLIIGGKKQALSLKIFLMSFNVNFSKKQRFQCCRTYSN